MRVKRGFISIFFLILLTILSLGCLSQPASQPISDEDRRLVDLLVKEPQFNTSIPGVMTIGGYGNQESHTFLLDSKYVITFPVHDSIQEVVLYDASKKRHYDVITDKQLEYLNQITLNPEFGHYYLSVRASGFWMVEFKEIK